MNSTARSTIKRTFQPAVVLMLLLSQAVKAEEPSWEQTRQECHQLCQQTRFADAKGPCRQALAAAQNLATGTNVFSSVKAAWLTFFCSSATLPKPKACIVKPWKVDQKSGSRQGTLLPGGHAERVSWAVHRPRAPCPSGTAPSGITPDH